MARVSLDGRGAPRDFDTTDRFLEDPRIRNTAHSWALDHTGRLLGGGGRQTRVAAGKAIWHLPGLAFASPRWPSYPAHLPSTFRRHHEPDAARPRPRSLRAESYGRMPPRACGTNHARLVVCCRSGRTSGRSNGGSISASLTPDGGGAAPLCECEVHLNRRLAPGVYLGVEPVRRSEQGHTIAGAGHNRGLGGPHAAAARRRCRGRPAGARQAGWRDARRARGTSGLVLRERPARSPSSAGRRCSPPTSRRTSPRFDLSSASWSIGRSSRRSRNSRPPSCGPSATCSRRESRRAGSERATATSASSTSTFWMASTATTATCRLSSSIASSFPNVFAAAISRATSHSSRWSWRAPAARNLGGRLPGPLRGGERRFLAVPAAQLLPVVSGLGAGGRSPGSWPPTPRRNPALRRHKREEARRNFALARACLGPPADTPFVIAVGGLVGSGKSTLAEALGKEPLRRWPAPNRTRKLLAGLDPTARGDATLYTPENVERVYGELLRRASDVIGAGHSVIPGRHVLGPPLAQGRRRPGGERGRGVRFRGGHLSRSADAPRPAGHPRNPGRGFGCDGRRARRRGTPAESRRAPRRLPRASQSIPVPRRTSPSPR